MSLDYYDRKGWQARTEYVKGKARGRMERLIPCLYPQGNRPLFEALASVCPPGKLRYLVYPAADDRDYWLGCRHRGAVVLGEEKSLEDES